MHEFLIEFSKAREIHQEGGQKEKKYKKTVILLDNASCHFTNMIKEWAKRTKIILLFNIPYFSKSNPVELFFSNLKNQCKNVSTENHYELAE